MSWNSDFLSQLLHGKATYHARTVLGIACAMEGLGVQVGIRLAFWGETYFVR